MSGYAEYEGPGGLTERLENKVNDLGFGLVMLVLMRDGRGLRKNWFWGKLLQRALFGRARMKFLMYDLIIAVTV